MSEYTNFIQDTLAPLGKVTIRRMFGGHGVFYQGLMFGLIDNEQLYLKADSQSSDAFTELGLCQFSYLKKNQPVYLSYFLAPESIYDDPNEALVWAKTAFEAALRCSTNRL